MPTPVETYRELTQKRLATTPGSAEYMVLTKQMTDAADAVMATQDGGRKKVAAKKKPAAKKPAAKKPAAKTTKKKPAAKKK